MILVLGKKKIGQRTNKLIQIQQIIGYKVTLLCGFS